MHGCDMGWAAFPIIEVISRGNFSQKRDGYLAASQSFSEETEVIILITNVIRKVLFFLFHSSYNFNIIFFLKGLDLEKSI